MLSRYSVYERFRRRGHLLQDLGCRGLRCLCVDSCLVPAYRAPFLGQSTGGGEAHSGQLEPAPRQGRRPWEWLRGYRPSSVISREERGRIFAVLLRGWVNPLLWV